MAASLKTAAQARTWRKDGFLISTDPSLFPVPTLIDIFNSEGFYWASAPSPDAMRELLQNSLPFGVYQERTPANPDTGSPSTNSLELVGIARLVTDFVTFAYLTDVWVQPGNQGKGLGRWLIGCVQEVVEAMPYLRRTVLFTGDWQRSVPFYRELLGMEVVETRVGEGLALMESKGKGHPSYGRKGASYD
ncbi:gcn5-related n-acetyltransferase [Microdochium bolleyi]|uniref:Gcn5-related n-acetyltransferase n=1 Tax=Microdochium bolleyi TaxID=196109 RepID=A0A136IXC7_9PEZI|nr:gcn5-related n-acetyltransferase [Microdochium bolleyi]